jgi:hypothetical protein
MLCGVAIMSFLAELLTQRRNGATLIAVTMLLLTTRVAAQSLDPNAPAPVRSSSVSGRIAARDLGDARLTDHYFTFTGTPGDLLITVDSHNLNGDVDVFTAGTLRPLLKLSLYAESTLPVTKGIYLRKRQELILRVEARSPNDDEGSYRLVFGGSFEPIIGGPDIAEAAETPTPSETPATTATGRKTKRVSSVGATIAEPEPTPSTEVAAAPTPEPTPEATPVETPKAEKSPEPATAKPVTTARNTRGRRPAGRRSTPPAPRVKEAPPTQEPKPQPKPKAAPEPPPEVGPRLVIETNDGTLINRSMSSVRRVTVENGQVVVINKDGTINRILLANVVRMSISQ